MHLENYKMADVSRLMNEFEREKECNNKDGRIDESRTKDNYSIPPRRTHYQLIGDVERRLGHVKHSNRKDLNVMSVWVVTCPQEIVGDKDKEKRFFEETYSFFQNRYGTENVMCGYVHMDETIPHMHVPVVPVKDGRVSAKALFNRTELSRCHKDLDDEMSVKLGMKGLILNGRTKGDYTVEELKERDRREAAVREREDAALRLWESAKDRMDKANAEEGRIMALEASVRQKSAEVEKCLRMRKPP